jgi:hypothetical protein
LFCLNQVWKPCRWNSWKSSWTTVMAHPHKYRPGKYFYVTSESFCMKMSCLIWLVISYYHLCYQNLQIRCWILWTSCNVFACCPQLSDVQCFVSATACDYVLRHGKVYQWLGCSDE